MPESRKRVERKRPRLRGNPNPAPPKPEADEEISAAEFKELVVSYLAQILEELKDLNVGMSEVMQNTEHLDSISNFSEEAVEHLQNIDPTFGNAKKSR